MLFDKPAKTLNDQIALLKQRGLAIENEEAARHELSQISYYRLSAYFHSFYKYGDTSHSFMKWATFNKIMTLYRFDRELRVISLDAIERIEVAFRCRLVQEYSIKHGPYWYENPKLYKSQFQKTYKRICDELDRSKEVFLSHYKSKYTFPNNPPSWMAIEVLSFGQLSILYKNLAYTSEKKAVADHFGISVALMESWIEHLVYIRNLCAHHSRLWNRTLVVAPINPKFTKLGWINIEPAKSNKIYLTLCIMAYMIKKICPGSYFTGKLKTLIKRLPNVDLKAAGFPEDWEKDPFWKKIYIPLSYKCRIMYFKHTNLFRKKHKTYQGTGKR